MSTAAPEPSLPEVSISTADTVVLELTPSDAQALARILARYDLIVGWRGPAGERVPGVGEDFDQETWHRVLVQLLAQAQNARLQISAPTVIVPIRRPSGARP